VQLQERTPTAAEQTIIDRARALLANRPAKAFVLMDGDTVLYSEIKAPADADSLFFGLSIGKTVTSMALWKAICSGPAKRIKERSRALLHLEARYVASQKSAHP
jgi:hypothetical protein